MKKKIISIQTVSMILGFVLLSTCLMACGAVKDASEKIPESSQTNKDSSSGLVDDESSVGTGNSEESLDDELDSLEANFMTKGDLIVANEGSDVVVLLDSDGNFKKIVYNESNFSHTITGLSWKEDTKEVLITVSGSGEVIAVSAIDGSSRTVISGSVLSSGVYDVVELSNGLLLVAEYSTLKLFNQSGIPQSWNSPAQPRAEEVAATSDGGFVVCSSHNNTGRVEKYHVNGTSDGAFKVVNASAAYSNANRAYGCKQLSNGKFVVSWDGSEEAIAILSEDLSAEELVYQEPSILRSPRGVEEKENGNILVLDSYFHHIVELDSDLELVRVFGDTVLNSPAQIIEVPTL